jgi:hypothetical protein
MTKTIKKKTKKAVEVKTEEAGKVLSTTILTGKVEGVKAEKSTKVKKKLPKIEHEVGYDNEPLPEMLNGKNFTLLAGQTAERAKSIKLYRRRKIWLPVLGNEKKLLSKDLFGKEEVINPIYFGIGEKPLVKELVGTEFPDKIVGFVKYVKVSAPNRTLFGGIVLEEKAEVKK